MGIFENCCCFFDLRVGAALSGVYSLVTSCVPFVFAVVGFISLYVYDDIYVSGLGEDIFTFIRICLAVFMSIWGLHILTSFLLLVATCKNDRYKMIPYMLCTGLIVIIHLGGTSAVLYMLIAVRVPYVAPGPFAGLTISLTNGILNLYCLLVVVSRYQDLRDEFNSGEYKQNDKKMKNDEPISKAEENDYV